MKCKKEDLRALDLSIVHWRGNAAELRKADKGGKKISSIPSCHVWCVKDDFIARFDDSSCDLCDLNGKRGDFCFSCVLSRAGYTCDHKTLNSPWQKCVKARGNKAIIGAAEEMLRALLKTKRIIMEGSK